MLYEMKGLRANLELIPPRYQINSYFFLCKVSFFVELNCVPIVPSKADECEAVRRMKKEEKMEKTVTLFAKAFIAPPLLLKTYLMIKTFPLFAQLIYQLCEWLPRCGHIGLLRLDDYARSVLLMR